MKPTPEQIKAAASFNDRDGSFVVFIRFENEAEAAKAEASFAERPDGTLNVSRSWETFAPDQPCLMLFIGARDEFERFVVEIVALWPKNGRLENWDGARPIMDAVHAKFHAEFLEREKKRLAGVENYYGHRIQR